MLKWCEAADGLGIDVAAVRLVKSRPELIFTQVIVNLFYHK